MDIKNQTGWISKKYQEIPRAEKEQEKQQTSTSITVGINSLK